MAKLDDLLAANPEAKAEYDRTMKAQADAAATADAEKNKRPATRAELKEIVPATMKDREALIGELQDEGATVAQAFTKVTAKLAAQNAELAKEKEKEKKQEESLGQPGGGPALRLSGGGGGGGGWTDKNATYDSLVAAEQERLIGTGMDPREALGKARIRVSRDRQDLLGQKNQQLRAAARTRTA